MDISLEQGPFASWVNDIGAGWRELLQQLGGEVCEICPDVIVLQVKEKFGLLRVYVQVPDSAPEGTHERVLETISRFEQQSGSICQRCGAPGERRSDNFWIRTTCDNCA